MYGVTTSEKCIDTFTFIFSSSQCTYIQKVLENNAYLKFSNAFSNNRRIKDSGKFSSSKESNLSTMCFRAE